MGSHSAASCQTQSQATALASFIGTRSFVGTHAIARTCGCRARGFAAIEREHGEAKLIMRGRRDHALETKLTEA